MFAIALKSKKDFKNKLKKKEMTDMFIKTEYQLNTFSVVVFPFSFFSIILYVKYIIFFSP